MKTLKQLKTHTERNCHSVLIAAVANPSGNTVVIGPFANSKEMDRAILRSEYPVDKVAGPYQVLIPYPEGAVKPKATDELAAVGQ